MWKYKAFQKKEYEKALDEYIKECYMAGKPIILNMPKN